MHPFRERWHHGRMQAYLSTSCWRLHRYGSSRADGTTGWKAKTIGAASPSSRGRMLLPLKEAREMYPELFRQSLHYHGRITTLLWTNFSTIKSPKIHRSTRRIRLSGVPIWVYNKSRKFVCSIFPNGQPSEYRRLAEAIRSKGYMGLKGYFIAELENRDRLKIKVGEILAVQPWWIYIDIL
jgi:hypothetical protein